MRRAVANPVPMDDLDVAFIRGFLLGADGKGFIGIDGTILKPGAPRRSIDIDAPPCGPPAGAPMIDETRIHQFLAAGQPREAFELIVERFREKIFHLALSMTKNPETAADLAQDTLLRVWKALPAYNGTASLSTWIYTIARNVCLTEVSRSARRRTVPLDAPGSAEIVADLEAPTMVESGASIDIEGALARLPERHQRVLRLFYLEQRSYEETAELLALPLGTMKTHLFRARRELVRMASRDAATTGDTEP